MSGKETSRPDGEASEASKSSKKPREVSSKTAVQSRKPSIQAVNISWTSSAPREEESRSAEQLKSSVPKKKESQTKGVGRDRSKPEDQAANHTGSKTTHSTESLTSKGVSEQSRISQERKQGEQSARVSSGLEQATWRSRRKDGHETG